MHPSYPFETTAEDAATMLKWKLRLALVYGAILLAIVAFAMTRPQDHIDETSDIPSNPAISSASAADRAVC
jgi:hypothetical protein